MVQYQPPLLKRISGSEEVIRVYCISWTGMLAASSFLLCADSETEEADARHIEREDMARERW